MRLLPPVDVAFDLLRGDAGDSRKRLSIGLEMKGVFILGRMEILNLM
jgi:hypothetical protein